MQTYINSDNKDSQKDFIKALKKHIKQVKKSYDEICITCIGTDRSTGDSLGPLIGYKLNNNNVKNVKGNLNNPVHAKNIDEIAKTIPETTLNIAVDACLGRMDHVGYITIHNGSLKPGSGVGKKLNPIGDISINGIVNFGGYMDYLVLQNTRLNVVMKMADIISNGITETLLYN